VKVSIVDGDGLMLDFVCWKLYLCEPGIEYLYGMFVA
jgi:hypothetical protein